MPFLSVFAAGAQEVTDSLFALQEVVVRSFEQSRSLHTATALHRGRDQKTSLVQSFNAAAGVRLEERSPGSYRLNIRGSSLRSPFGVRNVKVYWNDIPLTDPGGNTYFNQLTWNNFSYSEIFKGPAGSLYGSGTGGLVLLNSMNQWHPGASMEYIIGSNHLHNLFTAVQFGNLEHKNLLTCAHNQTNGYRQHSALRKDNFSWTSQLHHSGRQQLTASVLFTNMYYQTPGALTLAEFRENPKAARPAAGSFPSSVAAKAAIDQKNITVGFTNIFQLSSAVKNTATLFAAFNQVKNPAVRNYERRSEPSFGGRTVFSIQKNRKGINSLRISVGSEAQGGWFNTQVFSNTNGNPGTLQTNDDIQYTVYSIFSQTDWSYREKWFIHTGLGLNKTKVSIRRLSTMPVYTQLRTYQNEIAPRFAIRRKLSKEFSLLVSAARGFSPPTIAELLPSTGVISSQLEAEYGWNLECTAQYHPPKNRLRIDATAFHFLLRNALVQRRDSTGSDYFINAGSSRQKGLELSANFASSLPGALTESCLLNAAFTLHYFRYGNYIRGGEDYSGKMLPSVPQRTVSLLADVVYQKGFYSSLTCYSASSIFLNDANTVSASAYFLLGLRLGFKKSVTHALRLNGYAGADNLLDETYSLGNDINAAAGRYYNAAPRRNFYAGIALQWISRKQKEKGSK